MNTLITVVVIASCALASNLPKTRFKRDGWSVDLANAITARNEAEAIRLIEAGASINAVDSEGQSPLHHAAEYGLDKILKVLIDRGANVNLKNLNESTPLHNAAWNNRQETAKNLIDRGADVNSKDKWGETSLHKAAYKGHDKLMEILIDRGADVNSKNIYDSTVLFNGVLSFQEKTVKILLDRGADVNFKNKRQEIALHWVGWNGIDKLVKILIDHHADVNSQDENLWSPLHAATWNGYDKVVELLVNGGADINIKTNGGRTARDLAVEKGHTKIVDWLDAFSSLTKVKEVCKRYSTAGPSDFIAEGRPVDPKELPWMAALGYADDFASGIRFQCGGVVLSEKFILTAAHCAKLERPPILVRLGNVNLTGRRTKNRYIKEIIRHEGYSGEFKKNDIALLQLVKNIEFTPDIRPACLETDLDDQDPNVKLIVSGWGSSTTLSTETSDILLKAEVQTVPLSQCNETYLKYNQDIGFKAFRNGISESQYCANDPVGKGDSCHGDSGGPLQIFHNSHTAHIVGIVSFGVSCGTGLPTVYTRVAYYASWIKSHVWKEE